MENEEKDHFNPSRHQFITVLVVSIFFGGLAGGVAGFISGSLYGDSVQSWLGKPFGGNHSQIQDVAGNKIQLPQAVESSEEAVVAAVSKVSPAVVSIIVTKELQQYYNATGPLDDFFGFPFDLFFGPEDQQTVPQEPPATQKQQVGGGTGFIVSSDGLILTNKHVVADTAAEYSVILNDGKSHNATVVARDPFNDLALIKISAQDLPTVELGDSDQVKIGQTVIAIGFSLGEYSNSVTKGIISGIGRDIVASGGGEAEKLEGVFQTDAAINPGNSGGPLINLSGQVIGINTAINQSGQSVGFALPINSAKTVVESVKQNGRIVRAYIGVRYLPVDAQVKETENLSVDYGALIVKGDGNEPAVIPGSPADKAGLAENDIILEIDGVKLDQQAPLSKEIGKHQPGDTVSLKVLHGGEEKTVSVILEEYKEQ